MKNNLYEEINLPMSRDDATKKVFEIYKTKNKTFIESGTFLGNGIYRAFSVGYEKVYTCDINKEFVENAKKNFFGKDLIVVNEPSEVAFVEFLSSIDAPSLIWLDGHMMPDENGEIRPYTVKENLEYCPLVKEIDIIKKTKIKEHIIVIDDFKCFGTWLFDGLKFETLSNKILEINNNYKFTLYNEEIMVCHF
ncbi:MAG: hypothetical protein EBR67_09150 [Proteobacteria bacterium]|nr:hypothetical protein [Pseudomonadota bacterium]